MRITMLSSEKRASPAGYTRFLTEYGKDQTGGRQRQAGNKQGHEPNCVHEVAHRGHSESGARGTVK